MFFFSQMYNYYGKKPFFPFGKTEESSATKIQLFMNSSSKGHSLFTVEVPAPYPRQDFLFLSFNLDILELTWNFSIYTAQVWRQHFLSLEFWRASQHQRCTDSGCSKCYTDAGACQGNSPTFLLSAILPLGHGYPDLRTYTASAAHLTACVSHCKAKTPESDLTKRTLGSLCKLFLKRNSVIFWILQNRGVGLQGKIHCKLPIPYAF